MSRRRKIIAAVAAIASVATIAAVGTVVATQGGGEANPACPEGYAMTPDLGCIPIPRHALSATGTTGPTCVATSPVCVGDTLTANPNWIDTAAAQTWTVAARAELCATTVSGASWVKTGYPAGHWKTGLSELQGAKQFSVDKADYDYAHSALVLTTVSGKAFCSNKPRYAGGYWAQGWNWIATAYAYAGANPQHTGPTIAVTPGPRP